MCCEAPLRLCVKIVSVSFSRGHFWFYYLKWLLLLSIKALVDTSKNVVQNWTAIIQVANPIQFIIVFPVKVYGPLTSPNRSNSSILFHSIKKMHPRLREIFKDTDGFCFVIFSQVFLKIYSRAILLENLTITGRGLPFGPGNHICLSTLGCDMKLMTDHIKFRSIFSVIIFLQSQCKYH